MKARAILSAEKAIEIFKARPKAGSITSTSTVLASDYNVSSKTIRDIWSGRSWYKVTYRYDFKAPVEHKLSAIPGRPKGSKDSKPRRKRSKLRLESNWLSAESNPLNPLNPLGRKYFGTGYESTQRQSLSSSPNVRLRVSNCFESSFELPPPAKTIESLLTVPSCSRIPQISENARFIDPFHDDWKHWDRISEFEV